MKVKEGEQVVRSHACVVRDAAEMCCDAGKQRANRVPMADDCPGDQ
jgi:hypothetical protein